MEPSDSPRAAPDFSLENRFGADGCVVCGVDEAGRGPLAGPVVAAAVILDAERIPDGIDDSKQLTAGRREELFEAILSSATVAVASAPPAMIDRLNIRGATLWAMARAVAGLSRAPGVALIDGRDVPAALACPGVAVIAGDGRSVSIAAASIVAKVARDRMCAVMDTAHPDYGHGRHKGYPTAAHLDALSRDGATPHHRASFGPVARLVTPD